MTAASHPVEPADTAHCRHDLAAGTCASCTPPSSRRQAVVNTRTTTARYRSLCPACELIVVQGSRLVWMDDRWICHECAEVLA